MINASKILDNKLIQKVDRNLTVQKEVAQTNRNTAITRAAIKTLAAVGLFFGGAVSAVLSVVALPIMGGLLLGAAALTASIVGLYIFANATSDWSDAKEDHKLAKACAGAKTFPPLIIGNYKENDTNTEYTKKYLNTLIDYYKVNSEYNMLTSELKLPQ